MFERSVFEGKVALVTGAASGIGEATARAFSGHGARVVVADVDDGRGEAVAGDLCSSGAEAIYIRCDVRDESQIKAMVDDTVRRFGALDYAFNNAGIAGANKPLVEETSELWDLLIAVDLKGVFLCMKYEIEQMLAQGGGAIVNCASIAGLVGLPGMTAYVAAKHGVVGMTKSAALDYATRNIRINAVCPGSIKTPLADQADYIPDPVEKEKFVRAMIEAQPINRWGEPREVANAVLLLCSPAASLILGHALAVDGGYVAR